MVLSFWFGVLSEDREKNCRIHQNYLVAFNMVNVKLPVHIVHNFFHKARYI